MYGWMDGRSYVQIPPVFYRTSSPSGPLPKKKETKEEMLKNGRREFVKTETASISSYYSKSHWGQSRHFAVSSFNFLKKIFYLFLGLGPKRGRNPVEYMGNLYVRMSVSPPPWPPEPASEKSGPASEGPDDLRKGRHMDVQ